MHVGPRLDKLTIAHLRAEGSQAVEGMVDQNEEAYQAARDEEHPSSLREWTQINMAGLEDSLGVGMLPALLSRSNAINKICSMTWVIIDFSCSIVVGTRLTEQPFEVVHHEEREIKVETCAEIIAKKMWHRGNRAKARDLFDLCAVADAEPSAIEQASPFMVQLGAAFLRQLQERAALVEMEFSAINVLGFQRPFAECMAQARSIIEPLLIAKSV